MNSHLRKQVDRSHLCRGPAPRCRPDRCGAGFTLIELLIVVTLIAVLLGLTVPLAKRVMAAVRGLQCQSNLREIGVGLRTYYQYSGGLFPPQRSPGRPEGLFREMAEQAGLQLSEKPMSGGYHWSVLIWPYHRRLSTYTCPCAPSADGLTDFGSASAEAEDGPRFGAPFPDAPTESYGLNTLLFRATTARRKEAGASWGLRPGEFDSELTFTTLNDQKRVIPQLTSRVLAFCGTSGFPVGHQDNLAWRDNGRANRREWHPWPGPTPYVDAPGYGSYYLFFDGRAEYRGEFPSRFEWALDLH